MEDRATRLDNDIYDSINDSQPEYRQVCAQQYPTAFWEHDWLNTSRRLLKRLPDPHSGKKMLTLAEMAMVRAADNTSMIEAHGWGSKLSRSKVLELFQQLERSQNISFHAWKTFVRIWSDLVYEKVPLSAWTADIHACSSDGPFSRIPRSLDSPSLEFLAHLIITSGARVTEDDFVSLAAMANLGVLEFIVPEFHYESVAAQPPDAEAPVAPLPRLTDRLFRTISEMDSPFPALRVLRIWGQNDLTARCLRYLARLPTLVLIDFSWIWGIGTDFPPSHARAPELVDHGWTQVPCGPCVNIIKELKLFCGPAGGSGGLRTFNAEEISESRANVVHAMQANRACAAVLSPLANGPDRFVVRETVPDDEVHADRSPAQPELSLAEALNAAAAVHARDAQLDRDELMDASGWTGVMDPCHTGYMRHWGELMYTGLGQANTYDRDLVRNDTVFATAGPAPSAYLEDHGVRMQLPPRPMATVSIGHCASRFGSRVFPTAHVSSHRMSKALRVLYTRQWDAIPGNRRTRTGESHSHSDDDDDGSSEDERSDQRRRKIHQAIYPEMRETETRLDAFVRSMKL